MQAIWGLSGWLPAWTGPWALIAARASGVAWTAPGFATAGLGWRMRLALAALLTTALGPMIAPEIGALGDVASLARMALAEAAVGAALGWSAALIVAGARQAGEVVGAQAGLSAAALLDPDAGEGMTPLGHLYGLVALATFLTLDGPLRTVGALAESYRAVPPGGLALSAETALRGFGQVGLALELSLRLAAPAALALTLAGLALALIARAAPAFPFWSLALPVRSFVGLLLVLAGLVALAATLAATWEDWPATLWREARPG